MSHHRTGELEETKAQTKAGYARLQSRKAAESVVTFRPHAPESLAAYKARVASAGKRRKRGEW
jgi:hypothetical protein